VWAYLYQKIPLQWLMVLPIVVAIIFMLSLIGVFAHKGLRPNLIWIWVAILFAGIGLYLPDAAVSSKRTHVAEYMFLAIIERRAFSFHHTGIVLMIWTALMTALLGVHDEILQGLHVQRYYGLRDMVVNAFGALSGTALGHALGLFERGANESSHSIDGVAEKYERFGVLILSAAVVLWVLSLKHYIGVAIPWWTVLPLLLVVLGWLRFMKITNYKLRTANIFYGFGAATLLVPLASELLSLDFR